MNTRIASLCAVVLLSGAPFASGEEPPETVADRPTEDMSNADREPARELRRNSTSDRLDLGATSIRGNQELPKVLVIVPWKDPGLGELDGMPVNRLVDEVLAPVDREVFLRQERYFDQLYGASKSSESGE